MIRAGTMAVLALLAAAPGPVRAQGHFADRDAQYTFSGVAFPAAADTFLVMRAVRWPQTSAGVQLHYASPIAPRAQLDIYVYPVGEGDEGGHRTLREEFDGTLEGIGSYARENMEGVEVAVGEGSPVTLTGPAGTGHTGWMALTTYTQGGETRRSLLYLFEKNGHFLKYRATHGQNLHDMLDPRIERFVAESLERVVPGGR